MGCAGPESHSLEGGRAQVKSPGDRAASVFSLTFLLLVPAETVQVFLGEAGGNERALHARPLIDAHQFAGLPERELDVLLLVETANVQTHLAGSGAGEKLFEVRGGKALRVLAVDREDEVAGMQTGVRGGTILHTADGGLTGKLQHEDLEAAVV